MRMRDEGSGMNRSFWSFRHLGRFDLFFRGLLESIFELLLVFHVMLYEFLGIMIELGRDLVANLSYSLNRRIVFSFHCGPPRSSRGVTSIGTNNPSISLTLRICPNLLALAR